MSARIERRMEAPFPGIAQRRAMWAGAFLALLAAALLMWTLRGGSNAPTSTVQQGSGGAARAFEDSRAGTITVAGITHPVVMSGTASHPAFASSAGSATGGTDARDGTWVTAHNPPHYVTTGGVSHPAYHPAG